MIVVFIWLYCTAHISAKFRRQDVDDKLGEWSQFMAKTKHHYSLLKHRFDNKCNDVCDDLPVDDMQPVCMMFSRYKRGYQYFVNQCHARRTICKENIVLHFVHPSRCMQNRQYFMPVN